MEESFQKGQESKKGDELKVFPIPFALEEMNDYIMPNTPVELSKEKIISQAIALHLKGNILEAEKYYQYFINQGFKDASVFSNYGAVLKDLGKLKEAELTTRKAIELEPELAEAHYNLGNIMKELGNLKEAELTTRKAIELDPDLAQAHYNLGNIMKELGNLKEAEISTRKAISLKPKFAEAHSNLGNTLRQLGKLNEAEISIRKAIDIKPNFAEAYSNLGTILKDLGNLKEAEFFTQKAIEIKPDLAMAYSNMGCIMSDLGKLEKAEFALLKAIEIKPTDSNSLLNLGIIYRDLGKLKKAEILIRKVIDLEPNLVQAHKDLGICLYLMGNKNLALDSIEKAYSLDSKEIGTLILLNVFRIELDKNNKYLTKNKKENTLIDFSLKSNPMIIHLPVDKILVDRLYTIKARDQEKYQAPTFGNVMGSDYHLFDKRDIIIQKFKEEIINILCNKLASDILIVNSFFSIFRSGGGLKSHNHLSKLDNIKDLNIASKKFSLVYYLSVGDQNCDQPGILKLEDPDHEILPYNGMIVIFPAERKHSVFYKGKKDRIIIGVNFYSLM